MSNKEFDNLKQELMWEGSSFVMLSNEIVASSFSIWFYYIEKFMICDLFQVPMNKNSLKLVLCLWKPNHEWKKYDKLKMKLNVCIFLSFILLVIYNLDLIYDCSPGSVDGRK